MVPYQDFINLLYIGPGETTEHEGDDGSLNRTVTEVKDFQNQYGDIRCRNRRPTAAFTKQHSQVFVRKTGRTCGKAGENGEKQTGYFKAPVVDVNKIFRREFKIKGQIGVHGDENILFYKPCQTDRSGLGKGI